MRFCIDLDGVIANKKDWSFEDSYERQKEMLLNIEPVLEVIQKINLLFNSGHTIIIHTSRIWHDFDATTEWLKKHNVKYHTIIFSKPLAEFYIDDKNMTINDFLKSNI